MLSPSLKTASPAWPGSHYVTLETARKAIELTTPMIEAAREDRRMVGSGFLYVVIMDPALTPHLVAFDQAILHEHAFGDPLDWDADYAGFAREKAKLSWHTGMDSHRLQTQYPERLRAGDSLLAGGVCLDGIVVAASGAFPWYDEAFAGSIALCLRALAKEAREADVGRPALIPYARPTMV